MTADAGLAAIVSLLTTITQTVYTGHDMETKQTEDKITKNKK